MVSGTCAAPDSVKVTIKRVDIVLKDATTATISQTPNLTLTLTRSSQDTGKASDAPLLSAGISADQNSLASCRLSFKLGETTVTLSNFS